MINAKEKEFRRQIFHIVFGLGLIILIVLNIISFREIFWLSVLSVILSILSLKFKIPILKWFLDNMERKEDREKFPGKGFIFFLLGILLALKLFDKNIALAGIVIMVFADSISHLVGFSIKKTRFKIGNNKNIEGVIIGMVIGGVCASFFVNALYAFPASIVAMLVESFGLRFGGHTIDDNLYIPITAGIVIYLFKTGFQVLI